MIQVRDLSFGYRKAEPLFEDLCFDLQPGQIARISGPNGSGKSTLIDLIRGRQTPWSGTIERLVQDSQISYVPQTHDQPVHMPVSLGDLAELFDAQESEVLADNRLQNQWNTASGGEKKRLLLARALHAQAKLLVIDEPFNHLDRAGQVMMVQTLKKFVDAGGAIILVSHFADDLLPADVEIRL